MVLVFVWFVVCFCVVLGFCLVGLVCIVGFGWGFCVRGFLFVFYGDRHVLSSKKKHNTEQYLKHKDESSANF